MNYIYYKCIVHACSVNTYIMHTQAAACDAINGEFAMLMLRSCCQSVIPSNSIDLIPLIPLIAPITTYILAMIIIYAGGGMP